MKIGHLILFFIVVLSFEGRCQKFRNSLFDSPFILSSETFKTNQLPLSPLFNHKMTKDINKLVKLKRHSLTFEALLNGFVTIGYTYDFIKQDKLSVSLGIAAGTLLKKDWPVWAYFLPHGIESVYKLKPRFGLSAGIYNTTYVHFRKDKTDPTITDMFMPIDIVPFFGVSWQFERIQILPKVYFDVVTSDSLIFPSLKIKYYL
jgi:hypothetical protein